MRTQDGKCALIVPMLLVLDYLEKYLRKRVNEPVFTMAQEGLLPDNRIVNCMLKSTRAVAQ